jgi:hypothetical protein
MQKMQKGAWQHTAPPLVYLSAAFLTHRTVARRSSTDTPQADVFIESLIALAEHAPPLSLDTIERCILSSDSSVLVLALHDICMTSAFPYDRFIVRLQVESI